MSIKSEKVSLPDPRKLVHLQFRRYAGCPVCNLHLQSIVKRHGALIVEGLHEIVVFHSSEKLLKPFLNDLPFTSVADPDRKLYAEFGVRSSMRSILSFETLKAIIRSLKLKRPSSQLDIKSGVLGLPADFLIAPDGTVLDLKYGTHAFDQWSVDEILTKAKTAKMKMSQYLNDGSAL